MPLKAATAAATALLLLAVLIAAVAQGVLTSLLGTGGARVPGCAPPPADIPPDYCVLYVQAAATCPRLDWTVLAAIGKIETNHGRSHAPGVSSGENTKGAAGPMQFLAPTFAAVTARHPLPPGGASPPSRYNPHDAIHAAAYYLCDSGAGRGDLDTAIWTYNHSPRYVHDVLARAHAYATAAASTMGTVGNGDCATLQAPRPAAYTALNYACGQRDLPYVWGGNGPADGGFDCSGLTTAAYAAAGITLPRTAQTQYRAGPPVPARAPLQPGDLIFYGTPSRVHHVGLYLGHGLMIDAPDVGQVVTTEPYRWNGDDYLGATRPWRPVK